MYFNVGLLLPTCMLRTFLFLPYRGRAECASYHSSFSQMCHWDGALHCNEFSLLCGLFYLSFWKNGVIVAFSYLPLGCLYYLVKTSPLRSALFAHCVRDRWSASGVAQAPELFSQAGYNGSSDLGLCNCWGGGLAKCSSSESGTEQSHFLHSCTWFLFIFVITLLKFLECYNEELGPFFFCNWTIAFRSCTHIMSS